MKDIYWGIDVGQLIFAGVMILILVGFATWAYRLRERVVKLEEIIRKRDFRELEPEGYDEEGSVDAFSEGARLEADEKAARERDIMEHSGR